jgi:WD40 repeat protein
MPTEPETFPEPSREKPSLSPATPFRRVIGDTTGTGWPATLAPEEVALLRLGQANQPPTPGICLPALPGYEILDQLGNGGMGIVYRARQTALNRIVAVKCLRSTQLTGEDLARFRREAEAMAGLAHPNIVPVYDVGNPGGQPFFSMELLPGGSLTHQLGGNPLAGDEAARLVLTLAQAVQHAHEHGIVHRDLKPANVLLTTAGVPKIADFGLARTVTGGEDLTQSGAILGTPSYMAPEQTRPGHGEVSAQTDVYALGAILYELLTGRPPFKAATPLDTIIQVASLEPVSPRRLQPQIPRDLETICLKCLQKEPRKRYGSARALAEDLEHFLAREPVQARPSSPWERGVKWARRRPAVAALSGLILLVTVLGFGLVTWQWLEAARQRNRAEDASRRARTQADQAEQAKKTALVAKTAAIAEKEKAKRAEARARAKAEEAERNLATHTLSLANGDLQINHLERAESRLEEIPKKHRGWEWQYLKHLCHTDLRTLRGHTKPVWDVAFHPDGRRLASSSWDGTTRLWDLETGKELHCFTGHAGKVFGLAFRPDGKQLASAGLDGTVRLWDVENRLLVRTCKNHWGPVSCVSYRPDGKHLASGGSDRTVRVWDPDTGKEVMTLPGHNDSITGVAYSPDGRQLAASTGNPFGGTRPGEIRIYGTSGSLLRTLTGHHGPVANLAFSPDGKRLASASWDLTVKIWNLANGKVLLTLTGHRETVWGVAFSPDGRSVASSSDDATVRLWDLSTGLVAWTYQGHYNGIANVKFSPEGWKLASGSDDGTVKIWNTMWSPEAVTLNGHTQAVSAVAFSPQTAPDSRIASAGADGTVKIWNASTGLEIRTLAGHTDQVASVAFSPDGQRLASASWDKTVKLWDVRTGKLIRTFRGHRQAVTCVAFQPLGKELATGSRDKTVKIWQVVGGKEIRTLAAQPHPILDLAYSRQGRILASSAGTTGKRGIVTIWDSKTGRELGSLPDTPQTVWNLAFSPRGPWLATASGDYDKDISKASGQVELWDVGTYKKVHTLRGHTHPVKCVVFSPDGERLVSAGQDHQVKVWDVSTGQEVLTFRGSQYRVYHLAFAPDCRALACASPEDAVKIWDLREFTPAVARDRRHTVRVNISAWHRSRARACGNAGQWHGAVFHLNCLIAAGPRKAELFAERGYALGRLAQWDRAEEDLTTFIKLQPEIRWACARRGYLNAQQGKWPQAAKDYVQATERGGSDAPVWVWSQHALLRLQQKDPVGYRRACAALLKHFAATRVSSTANTVAQTCSWFPGAVKDYGPVLTLSEGAVTRYPDSGYYLGVFGGVLYRGGKYEDAIRRLLESGRTRDSNTATEWLFLAMAHHRQGHAGEARQWLDKAKKWLDDNKRSEAYTALSWVHKLEVELLCAEAEALVNGKKE